MIESAYWRDQLKKDIIWLKKNQKFKRWSEKRMVLYERKLMIVAFQIRSLLERPKISREYAEKKLPVTRYNKIGEKKITRINMDYYEVFDMNKPIEDALSTPLLCNQLIHYYLMFAHSYERQIFHTLLVVSDYKRNTCLFEIDIKLLIDFFAIFAKDDSSLSNSKLMVICEWDEKNQDYKYNEYNEYKVNKNASRDASHP